MQSCDDGLCVAPQTKQMHNATNQPTITQKQQVSMLFFTDPICSHCWAVEPAVRKFSALYDVPIDYIHGGLLPGWQGFSDAGNGIRGPRDVVPHWYEVAKHTGQPINPNVWLDDPLDSSWPACFACLAVRQLAPQHEEQYLRLLREAVFLEARNIAKPDILIELAVRLGIDAQQFKILLDAASTKKIFDEGCALMHNMGMRGFPSIVFVKNSEGLVVRGATNFATLESAYLKISQVPKAQNMIDSQAWIDKLCYGTSREFAEVFDCSIEEAEKILNRAGMKSESIAGSKRWSIS